MTRTDKRKNFELNSNSKDQPNKRKFGANNRISATQYKKPRHGAIAKSKDVQKKERANKFQERQALRAQKQKQLEEERAKAQKIKEEKIRQYKKKRLEKTKAISKRTQRGQPLMKDRMQLLLKQIQEMKKSE